MSDINYHAKYLKHKTKYLELLSSTHIGGTDPKGDKKVVDASNNEVVVEAVQADATVVEDAKVEDTKVEDAKKKDDSDKKVSTKYSSNYFNIDDYLTESTSF